MRFEQSAQVEPHEGVWWQPSVIGEIVGAAQAERLLYAVVDDLDAAAVTLVGYPWPQVTEAGTLTIRQAVVAAEETDDDADPLEPGTGVWLRLADDGTGRTAVQQLQEYVNARRLANLDHDALHRLDAPPAPERSLRVGDAFALVLSEPPRAVLDRATGKWHATIDASTTGLHDITYEARLVSRAAFLAVASPPMTQQQLDELEQAAEVAARDFEGDLDRPSADTELPSESVESGEFSGEASHQAFPAV